MKTLDRYISVAFLKNLAVASLGLTFVYVFQGLLTSMLDGEFSVSQLVVYQALVIPAVFVQMLPPSILIATVLTLSGLNRTNELVAIYSIGIGLKRIMTLLLLITFLVCCVVLFMQDRILPPLFKTRTTYYWREMKQRKDFHLDIKQNKIWYRSQNLIYNLRAFNQTNQTIVGMTVYSFDEDFNLQQTVEAETAKYTPQGWKLQDGVLTQFSKDHSFPETQKFREIKLAIPETPKDFQEIEKEVDGLKIAELKKYIDQNQKAGLDVKANLVKFHSRFSLSFIPIVMCILGVPFSVRGRREGGLAKDMGICLGITFFYWLFFSVGLSLGTNGALPPFVAAWASTAIFGALALYLVSKKEK